MQTISNLSVPQPPPQLFPLASSLAPVSEALNGNSHAAGTPQSISTRPAALKQPMADRENWQGLLDAINLASKPLQDNDNALYVLSVLNLTQMAIHPDSSHHKKMDMGTKVTQSLKAFLNATGLPLPTSKAELLNLKQEVAVRIAAHPLGDLGGGLSWPVPLDQSQQHRLRLLTMNHGHHLGDKPLVMQTKSVLDFLAYQNPIPADAINNPAKTLEFLVSSPEGQLMGKALQLKLNGVATENSHNDYLLAAISAQMDHGAIQSPQRNTLAGFDVAGRDHWGKPASAIVEGLSRHLSSQRRTSTEMAQTGAYVLLARTAPEFLIKDIPANVTYGSPAWVNLAVAAASIEAQSPGSVPNLSFAQVMLQAESAALAQPEVTKSAQRSALIDWAVVNGVIAKRPNDDYTPAQLEDIRVEYNQQLTERMTASTLLEATIPTRKEIALAKLIERFGDLGPLFEEKLIHTSSRAGRGNRTQLSGKHSLLDIAMMDLPNPAQFHSVDPRILPHLAALNASPRFGVTHEFEQQFNRTIADKKTALKTALQQLIAQLPLDDRKNFEHGAISFYQESSHTLGKGILPANTANPKNQELLVRIEQRAKDPVAYAINVERGTIEPVGIERVPAKTYRTANRVFETKAFTPKGGEARQRAETTPSSESPPKSFSSARTQYIADAFVEHFDLDNPQIKQQARGLTTLDEQKNRAEPVEQFLLDLIPFRSAIVNFQKGNYGEGAVDLAMDVFGFLTAGVGTAAKVAKVGRSAASGASKILKGAKIIGGASIRAFNPADGLIDLSVGATRFLGKGITQVNKGISALKGATGSYDLLKTASKEFGVAATGSLKVAEHSVETGAILQNGKWYAFDPDKMQPYGGPLNGFVPNVAALDGNVKAFNHNEIVNWLGNKLAPPTATPDLALVFEKTIAQGQVIDPAAYKRGYDSGKPEDISGYFSSMDLEQLKELTVTVKRTPEEIGTLVRTIEKKRVETSLNNTKIFSEEISSAGGKITPMPQGFYLSQTDLLSEGECAALSNAMALAIQEKKQGVLIENFFASIANPHTPRSEKFRNELTRFQQQLENRVHGTQVPRQGPPEDIISELANATASKTLIIRDKGHALTAGVTIENNNKQWFYYDPNYGLATFPTEESMRKGLDGALRSGRSNVLFQPYGTDRAKPEYKFAEFSELDLMNSTGSIKSLSGLFSQLI